MINDYCIHNRRWSAPARLVQQPGTGRRVRMRRTPELDLCLMSSKVEKPHCRWVILFNDKSGTIYFKGDSKVYLLQKCKSLAGDFKFHVKCCWNRCKNFTMGMGKKPQKLILLKLEKHHCRWNNWRWCIYFLLYYLTWHGI